jgi:hypothetical protein
MPFVDCDIVVREVDEQRWELVAPVVYEGNTETITIPAGFRTDFASVPRIFVWLLPRYGRYTKAAILHDWLCGQARDGGFRRSDADGLFRRSMRELGVPFVRRWIMWAAVRWGAGPRSLVSPGLGQLGLVVLVTLPTLALVVVPGVAVFLTLIVFWLVELVLFIVLKPFSKKQVNRPRLLLSAP